jgi:hypothetical protein
VTARAWRYGIGVGAALGVLILLSVVAVLVRPGSSPGSGAIPARVYAPLFWQGSVQSAPAGRAALLISGTGPFTATIDIDVEDYALIVSRDGAYRRIGFNALTAAGEEILLAPDGRLVAATGSLAGANGTTATLDLTTGAVRSFNAGMPVAWLPDDRLLTYGDGQLRLLELSGGTVRDIAAWAPTSPVAAFAAVSPDGSTVVVQNGRKLHLIDLATATQRALDDLAPNQRLAGPGALRRDGRIGIWTVTGCLTQCSRDEMAARTSQLTYVDSKTGGVTAGPQVDSVTGPGARLIGWQDDGDAVVLAFAAGRADSTSGGSSWPDDDAASSDGPSQLLAMHPGGGHASLVDLPRGAVHVEVASDLLSADQFGGPAPSTLSRYGDWLWPHRAGLGGLAGGLALVLAAAFLVHRRSRLGPSRPRVPTRSEVLDRAD